MGRLLDIVRGATADDDAQRKSLISTPCSLDGELPVADPYAERMRLALDQMTLPSYPTGMIPWLDTARPDLYVELTSRIPDEISRLWNNRVPLEDFEAVVDQLVSTHREGCRLYREEKKRRKRGAAQAQG